MSEGLIKTKPPVISMAGNTVVYGALAVFAVAVIALAVIYLEPSEKELIAVLEKSNDFRDFSSDFRNGKGRDFEPVLQDSMSMTYVNIKAKKALWEQDPGTAPFVAAFDGVEPSATTYYVEFSDREYNDRGAMAVLDMAKGQPLKFFAVIRLSVSAGT